ncbi:rac GTPase-activating protein 1-like protein, partial [Leptotrombidium deliense]
PLITRVLWRDFARATDLDGERKEDMLRINVSDLPVPNKDTIAYIILHLKRILLKISNEKQKHSLIKVFSKMMIGNSIINPTTHILESEAAKQEKIMQSLLELSDDYWNRILSHTSTIESQNSRKSIRCSGIELRGVSVGRGIPSPLVNVLFRN